MVNSIERYIHFVGVNIPPSLANVILGSLQDYDSVHCYFATTHFPACQTMSFDFVYLPIPTSALESVLSIVGFPYLSQQRKP